MLPLVDHGVLTHRPTPTPARTIPVTGHSIR
jgi:hypothetical protein